MSIIALTVNGCSHTVDVDPAKATGDVPSRRGRSHIRWTIRIRPARKDPAGNPVDLKGIFDGIENGVASGKPYLRPMIPLTPSQSIINVVPRS